MGVFHENRGELHGVTIIVDTVGSQIFVGRCDTLDGDRVVLLDADVHRQGDGGVSKEEYVSRAARQGIWKKLDHVAIDRTEIATIRRLGEIPI